MVDTTINFRARATADISGASSIIDLSLDILAMPAAPHWLSTSASIPTFHGGDYVEIRLEAQDPFSDVIVYVLFADNINFPLKVSLDGLLHGYLPDPVEETIYGFSVVATSMNGTNATATPESASTLAGATATNQSQQVATIAPTNRPAATSAPAVNPGTYIIQFGEFPYCLARRFDVDPDALLAANGLADGQNIQPGTALVIPTGSGGFPGNRSLMAHPSTWIVDPGDTVYSIACAYGDVNPLSIVSANGLTGDYELTVGTVLQIP